MQAIRSQITRTRTCHSLITTVITIARASPRLMTIVVRQSLQLLPTLCDMNWSVYQGLPTWGRRYGECKSLPQSKITNWRKSLVVAIRFPDSAVTTLFLVTRVSVQLYNYGFRCKPKSVGPVNRFVNTENKTRVHAFPMLPQGKNLPLFHHHGAWGSARRNFWWCEWFNCVLDIF